jgi:hypothetical protein
MRAIDQSFYVPRTPVAIIDCGAPPEACAIRSLLEGLSAVVTMHLPGTPGDFLLALGQDPLAPKFVIICGHGDKNGIVFGEYGPGIDTSCLVEGSLPARALAGKIELPGRVVLSTACETGVEDFGRAFLDGGVGAYIAPLSSPDGADALLFVHHFFHNILRRGMASEAAWLRARSYDEESGTFMFYGARDVATETASRDHFLQIEVASPE